MEENFKLFGNSIHACKKFPYRASNIIFSVNQPTCPFCGELIETKLDKPWLHSSTLTDDSRKDLVNLINILEKDKSEESKMNDDLRKGVAAGLGSSNVSMNAAGPINSETKDRVLHANEAKETLAGMNQKQDRKRNGSPTFYRLLEQMGNIHDSKSHDYASNVSPYANYHFAGQLSKLFDNPDDSGFIGRIAEKLYRLANLENSGKLPKNETIEDTEIDILTIMALWISDRRDRRDSKPSIFDTTENQLNKKSVNKVCTRCGITLRDLDKFIQHAIGFHGATINVAQRYIMYPDKSIELYTT